MFANHPSIAKRWFAEYGHASSSAGQGQKHEAGKDFKGLTPGAKARHTPKRATEQQAQDEASPILAPGTGTGPLGASYVHRGLKGRDVRAAAIKKARK